MSNRPHRARKRFGQNFLHDEQVIAKIVAAINPKPGQAIVEIGPGKGALTQKLLDKCERLTAIELDRDLLPLLMTNCASHGELTVHQEDALKFDFSQLGSAEQPMKVVGNLPYNISTPLLFHLLDYRHLITDMHFMLQKEVVERLCAPPGDSHYGRLSIMAQYYAQADWLFLVRPGSFSPAPKVDSAVVRLTPYNQLPYPAQDEQLLQSIVKAAFGQRRKTLRNALKNFLSPEDWQALGLDPGDRPERLTVANYVSIANHLSQKATNSHLQ